MDHLVAAERFIAERFPSASTAIVAGSTARGDRTTSSDIDLLLLGEDLFDGRATSEASTHVVDGEIFEVFAYTAGGFEDWAGRGIAQHRPVIVHMLLEGVAIRRDRGLDELRAHWARIIAAGPNLTEGESRFRRYVITDVLDDLRDSEDPLERRVEASILFERTAELMLLTSGRWIATGKWLPRRLRALDAIRAERLSAPLLADDLDLFATRVDEELERAGGRVQDGFVR
ncbi:nucleotidyltransferase domain-containing protein [Microbacterium sp. 1.5R]|uniref:nucleotidyltransferase domain-containing protein n=1 Tax=Microbacterium sp. 1.5R TaxID=1916917 RepID=UPI0011A0B1CD|nr:nucleotidyltransferase domain-containing protein [Microbacterium sp. 1.5R]